MLLLMVLFLLCFALSSIILFLCHLSYSACFLAAVASGKALIFAALDGVEV